MKWHANLNIAQNKRQISFGGGQIDNYKYKSQYKIKKMIIQNQPYGSLFYIYLFSESISRCLLE